MYADTELGDQEDVGCEHYGLMSICANIWYRCFLFLVNYARMKPEVALKALPTLQEVRIQPGITSHKLMACRT